MVQPESTGSAMTRGMNQASYGLSVAFAFVAVVLLFFFAGRWIDLTLGIEPWAEVVGSILGWTLGVVVVYYASQRELP
jgi:F0F1-type ATP synthase assembly protein I